MKYKVIGESNKPLMVFITGAGIGPYMWQNQVTYFKDYKKILFDLPGHGDNHEEPFTSIEALGLQVIQIISEESNSGKAILVGHSIGAQTLLWILDHHSSYVDQAVIISGLNKPIKGISWLIKPMVYMSMPLIKLRWFAKVQSKELSLPEAMFEAYYQGSLLISAATLTSILKENMSFEFSSKVGKLYPETLVIVGKYEKKIMKTSAKRTAQELGNHLYYEFNHGAHGIPYEMPNELNELMALFMSKNLENYSGKEVSLCQLQNTK